MAQDNISDETQLDTEYILVVEAVEFADKLDMVCEVQNSVKDDS